jgi:leucyl-tRNA synthetase
MVYEDYRLCDELLSDLDKLEGWPDAVKTMQRNWIGNLSVLEINFTMEGLKPISVFHNTP